MTDNPRYLTVKAVRENPKYPFTNGQLRDFLIKREQNGLGKAVRKIGKRLYIREDLLDAWIESHINGAS